MLPGSLPFRHLALVDLGRQRHVCRYWRQRCVASGAHHHSFPITANDLKPLECAGITLYSVVTGSGDITGGNENELLLGSAGADTINGKGGDDCILGGAGNDEIMGGLGNGIDILLGGSGDDQLNGQNGSLDVCYGGSGTDQFEKCETIYDP